MNFALQRKKNGAREDSREDEKSFLSGGKNGLSEEDSTRVTASQSLGVDRDRSGPSDPDVFRA